MFALGTEAVVVAHASGKSVVTATESRVLSVCSMFGAAYPLGESRFRYAAAVAAAAAVGGAATRRSVSAWYPGLHKPSWTPRSQVFGPVWTMLYAQMAYSAYRVARSSDPGRGRALSLWWLQLGLNAA